MMICAAIALGLILVLVNTIDEGTFSQISWTKVISKIRLFIPLTVLGTGVFLVWYARYLSKRYKIPKPLKKFRVKKGPFEKG